MVVAAFELPYFQAFDINGVQLPGAKLYSYLAQTSTPAPTYSDPLGLTLNTNPVVTDAAGRAFVYLPVGIGYKLNLLDALNVQQPMFPVDNILLADPTAFASERLWPTTMLPWTAQVTFNAAAFSGQGEIPAAGFLPADTFVIKLDLSCTQNFSTANGLVTLALGDGAIIKASGLGLTTPTVYPPIPWLTPLYPVATTLYLLAEGGTFGPAGQLVVTAFGVQFP